MKSRKRHMTDGIELPNQEKIRTHGEKETYKYLGIVEADTIKEEEMKEKLESVSLENEKVTWNQTILQEPCKRDKYRVSPPVRYSGPFLKGIQEELKQMNQRTRKLMTMHKALHPRNDADGLYISRKEEGRGLTSIEESVDTSIQWFEDYIETCTGRLITATRNNTDKTWINRIEITRKQKWEEKEIYGRFKRLTSGISQEKTRTLLRKGNLKREAESLLVAAQNNAIRTNHIKARVDKVQQM